MTIDVGVIGVGMIGQDHVRRLTHVLSGARVAAVTDVDPDRARAVACGLPGAVLHASGAELVADPAVDAVVVTSWGPTHEEYVLAAATTRRAGCSTTRSRRSPCAREPVTMSERPDLYGCGSAARARKTSPGPRFPRTGAEGAT